MEVVSENELIDKPVKESKPNIILTGFGPFQDIAVNASWIVIQELAKIDIEGYNLIIKEIPVAYNIVAKDVPELWKKYNPKLVIHCGVSRLAKTLVLEQMAHNNGFIRPDIEGDIPPLNCCVQCGCDCLETRFNMYQVCHDINSSKLEVSAVVSKDAGST